MPLSKNPKTKQAQVAGRMGLIRAIDKRVKSIESNVRAQETKKHYHQLNEKVLTNSLTLQQFDQINTINQGDGANSVDGNSYALTGIAGKFLIHNTSNKAVLFRVAVIRIKSGGTMTAGGESLFTGSAGLGLDFSSASETQKYYLPFNTKKYDIIFSKDFKVGGKNSGSTDDFRSNQILKFYKEYKNRKEHINTSSGSMDTSYRLIMFPVDVGMDGNTLNVEVTGQTTFYFKDN